MPNLTANGSTTPYVLFNATSGTDWRIQRSSGGDLEFQISDGAGGYLVRATVDAAHALVLTDGSETLTLTPGEACTVTNSSTPGELHVHADYVKFTGHPLYVPDGVKTAGDPCVWDVLTGTLSTSGTAVTVTTSDLLLGAHVLLEDPNNAGQYHSVPLGSSAANRYTFTQGSGTYTITIVSASSYNGKGYKIVTWAHRP